MANRTADNGQYNGGYRQHQRAAKEHDIDDVDQLSAYQTWPVHILVDAVNARTADGD